MKQNEQNPAARRGSENTKRDSKFFNQPQCTNKYQAELEKFAEKYPYLVHHIVAGGVR